MTPTLESIEQALQFMSRGATMAAPRGVVRYAIDEAARAVFVARIASGGWGPDRDHTCPAMLAEEIADGGKIGAFACSLLTDEEVSAATVERSAINGDWLRYRAGGHEWIIEVEYDGAPDGHTSYHVVAHGEAGRG